MTKPKLILIGLAVVLVLAIYVAEHPREVTVMAKAEKPASTYDSYVITVKRWKDHHRGGRYKRYGDLFGIELSHRGGMPVAAYEVKPTILQITNVVIAWPDLGEFRVAFDNHVTIKCTWGDGKATWERE
jgi:hypothetical protein